MSLTLAQGRDEILALVKSAWDVGTENEEPLFYWDVPHDPPKGPSEGGTDSPPSWARATLQYTGSFQASFAAPGSRKKWTRTGLLTIQIFTAFGPGLGNADALSQVLLDGIEGRSTPGGVWFRNVRPLNIGYGGAWFQTQILADFEFDEVK